MIKVYCINCTNYNNRCGGEWCDITEIVNTINIYYTPPNQYERFSNPQYKNGNNDCKDFNLGANYD